MLLTSDSARIEDGGSPDPPSSAVAVANQKWEIEMNTEKLKVMLAQLDDADDALWFGGVPRISAARALSPEFSVATRADIAAAGRVRWQNSVPVAVQSEPKAQSVAEAQHMREQIAEALPEPKPVPCNLETECEVAENAMIAQREIVKQAKLRARTARQKFGLALVTFQHTTGGPTTQEELHRRHAKSEYERRAAIARGEISPDSGPVSSIGNSVLDRTAAAMSGFKGPGSGNAFRRGAFPHQGGYTAPRVKLPGQR